MKLSRRTQEVFFLLITFVLLVLLYQFFASPLFRVEKMVFHGIEYSDPADLSSYLAPQLRRRIYMINPRFLEEEIIRNIPEIRRVRIARWLFPARLEVFVEERAPWLYWKEKDLWVDGYGVTLMRLRMDRRPKKLPILIAEPVEKEGPASLPPATQVLINQLYSLLSSRQNLALLHAIRINQDQGISIWYGEYLFLLGDSHALDKKIKSLYSLLNISEKYPPANIEYINISVPEKPAIKFKSG